MDQLPVLGKPILKRESTYDKTGGNNDRFILAAGESGSLEIKDAGCIKHIWITLMSEDPDYLRKAKIRMYWDGSSKPAVDSPFGDFFCLGFGEVRDIVSSAFCVSIAPHIPTPPGQAAFNCYFPMPFADGAKVEIENGCNAELIFYGHLDYEVYDSKSKAAGMGRFHAAYMQESTTEDLSIPNITGDQNYVALDIEGEGHYVGCNLSVDSRPGQPGKWWEGDDMIFVDGEGWPPAIHGTGTEDYFCNAWGIRREFSTPYYGISYMNKNQGDNYFQGQFTVYRFHILDPIPFRKSIRVTFEHGHGNDAANDFSSVAYWYQKD